MSSKGVLYFVWGDMDPLLQRSIASLRKYHPDLPYHVVKLPDNSTYLDKAQMYAVSPFDTTAYLDADTLIMGNLDYGFRKADQFGLACCVNESPWARRYTKCMEGDSIEYNAGVVFFDKIKSRPFFDAWTGCVRTVDSSSRFKTPTGEMRQGCNDQAGMAKAIEDTGFNPFVLPQNWNFRPYWQRSLVGPLKIWHDYGDPPQRLVEYSKRNEHATTFDTICLNDGPVESGPIPKDDKKATISWVMSVPRLGFQDNFFCGSEICAKYGINPTHYCGAFWGQCLERTMTDVFAADWIFSTDYDSVFKLSDFEKLCAIMGKADYADAIAGVQLRRQDHNVLAGIKRGPDDQPEGFELEKFKSVDLLECDIANFGFTLIRTSALRKMEHPWFLNVPNKDGKWEDGKQDEDIYFWRKFRAAGNRLFLATHIPVGHIEALVTWPDESAQPTFQCPSDFWKVGKPKNVLK